MLTITKEIHEGDYFIHSEYPGQIWLGVSHDIAETLFNAQKGRRQTKYETTMLSGVKEKTVPATIISDVPEFIDGVRNRNRAKTHTVLRAGRGQSEIWIKLPFAFWPRETTYHFYMVITTPHQWALFDVKEYEIG